MKGSTLGEGIDIAGGRARYDAQCKRLLSERSVLAWILKGCLAEFHNVEVERIASECIIGDPKVRTVPVPPGLTNAPRVRAGTSDTVPYEGEVRFDILFDTVVPDGSHGIEVIVNVEGQVDCHPGYPLANRVLFYCARMISSQYGEVFSQSHYELMRKVASIWVCPKTPHVRWNSIDRGVFDIYEHAELEGSVPRDSGLLEVVFVNLGDDAVRHIQGNPTRDMLGFLDTLFSTRLEGHEKRHIIEQVYQVPLTPGLREGVENVVHVVDMIRAEAKEEGLVEGKAQGLVEGKAQGLAEGKVQGTVEATLSAVRSIMEKTGWDAERALDVAGVPADELPRYLELLHGTSGAQGL